MRDREELFRSLEERITEIVEGPRDLDEKLQQVCTLLRDEVAHYDWVGFYLVDSAQRELYLGPFAGEATEHVRIPFGRGICGQAAENAKRFVVQDVSKEANYLSCSPSVRSEIVVPILNRERMVAQIDIDSHSHSPFTEDDTDFLEKLSAIVSALFSGRD